MYIITACPNEPITTDFKLTHQFSGTCCNQETTHEAR